MVKRSPDHDIIADILRRIQQAQAAGLARLDAQAARQIEAEARAHWGGERVLVRKHAHTLSGERLGHAERANRIERAYLQGQRLVDIAQTEGITTRRVLQIIKTR